MSRTWTDDELKIAIAESNTMSEVLRRINIRFGGGSFDLIKKHILRLGLNTSHFRHSFSSSNPGLLFRRKWEYDDIYCENSKVIGSVLRRCVIRNGVIKYVCKLCDNPGEHLGKKLTLQLDHENGVDNDNRPHNLRFLCPNCHSQTKTYSRVKLKTRLSAPSTLMDVVCNGCGKSFKRTRRRVRQATQLGLKQYCNVKCMIKADKTKLIERYQEVHNYSQVAREFKVSDMTVKKAVKFFVRP